MTPEIIMSTIAERGGNGLRFIPWIVFALFLGIVLFFLFTEHRAHTYGLLPWLFLAACPLLHGLMHRKGRNGHAGH